MTDPQNDVKCCDCGRLTLHASERCAVCRTPAGRLVTALTAERDGLRAELDKRVAPHCQHAADPGHSIDHGVHPDRVGPSVLHKLRAGCQATKGGDDV